MKKRAFNFPMTRLERLLGIAYIPVHAILLPYALVYALNALELGLSQAQIGLLYYGISALFCLLALNRYWRTEVATVMREPFRIIQAIILGYALYLCAGYVLTFILSGLQLTGDDSSATAYADSLRVNFGATTVTAVILSPIVSETLFRGALFGTLRTKSRLLAYVISAVVFALFNTWEYAVTGDFTSWWVYTVQYAPISIALAWCYDWSGNICAPVLLNALLNLISSVAIYWS